MTSGPDPRPRPQYGEYADSHEPAATTDAVTASVAADAAPPVAAPPHQAVGEGQVGTPLHAPTGQPATTPGTLPGVPHNLGVSGTGRPGSARPASAIPSVPTPAAPPTVTGPPTSSPAQPYQAQQAAPPNATAQPRAAQQAAPRKRPVDRVFTVLLLAMGAYGALNTAFFMLQLRAQFSLLAGALDVKDVAIPEQVSTIGTIGGILTLTLYALVLIFSIRRMRAGRLTFWVPLVAAVVSFFIYVLFTSIGYLQSPELVQALSQPDAFSKLLDYASKNPQ